MNWKQMKLKSWAVFSLVMMGFGSVSFAETKKAHEHGMAKLILAIETDTTGTIDLDVPADSIYGFEHKAKSKADKAAQEKGFKKLKDSSVIQFPAGCTVTNQKVELEAADHEAHHDEHEGEHADVSASYSVKCASDLSGKKVSVSLFSAFPKIKAISFQILSPKGQTENKVKKGNELILIP